jgi:hypothetical protein
LLNIDSASRFNLALKLYKLIYKFGICVHLTNILVFKLFIIFT